MTANPTFDDTALAALISSKICHDLAGQIGAINNGLELLQEESDEDTRYYALELIHNSARAAWAQLDFNRLAYGAASSLGAELPLAHLEDVARRHLESPKRKLHWQAEVKEIAKHHAKIILAVLSVAVTALPSGGAFHINLTAPKQANGSKGFSFKILCTGRSARVPEGVAAIFAGQAAHPVDGRLAGPFYAERLTAQAGLKIAASKDADRVVFTVEPRR